MILKLKSEQLEMRQLRGLEEKRQELEELCNSLEAQVKGARGRMNELEGQAQQEMNERVSEFATLYSDLLSKTVADIRVASLDDSYSPVINQGEYREASAEVAKRLMYYLVLLKLSLQLDEIAFPRFLLIDTPETAGIDPENLVGCINQISDLLEGSEKAAQVILTIGPSRLPKALERNVFLEIPDGGHLLTPNPAE